MTGQLFTSLDSALWQLEDFHPTQQTNMPSIINAGEKKYMAGVTLSKAIPRICNRGPPLLHWHNQYINNLFSVCFSIVALLLELCAVHKCEMVVAYRGWYCFVWQTICSSTNTWRTSTLPSGTDVKITPSVVLCPEVSEQNSGDLVSNSFSLVNLGEIPVSQVDLRDRWK